MIKHFGVVLRNRSTAPEPKWNGNFVSDKWLRTCDDLCEGEERRETGRKGESVRSLTLTDLHLSVPGNFMDPPQKWCNSTLVWMEQILSALAEEPCGKARSAAEVFSPLFWSQTEEEFWIIFASTHLSCPTPTPAGNPCLRYNEVPPLLSAESCRILSCPYCSMQW